MSISTQIAIVGGGPGGLAAALQAAQLGYQATVFEKKKKLGGAMNGGTGPFAVETILQRRMQRVVTKEEAFKFFMDYTHWQANPGLVAAYVNKSPETLKWLEDIGCVFDDLYAYIEGGNHTWHSLNVQKSGGFICDLLWKEAEKSGAKAYLNTRVDKLVMEGDAVKGLVVQLDGQETMVYADAVIIATGGFGNNAEMVKQYTPYELGKTISTMTTGCDGEGLRMAWDVGASKGCMFYDAFAGIITPMLGGPGGFCTELRSLRQPNLLVNKYGKRFTDETVMSNGAYGINTIRQQPGGHAFMITTDEIVETYKKDGFPITMPAPDPFTGKYQDWPEHFEEKMQEIVSEKKSPDLFVASSIEELAIKMNINTDVLSETVKEYNSMCDAGEDPVFHKRRDYLKPLRGRTFYAARLYANSFGTLGGLNINEKAEVLTEEQLPIRGLYAAGNDANTICLDSYCFGMPGHTSGFAFNTGRIAAENAAEYIRNK